MATRNGEKYIHEQLTSILKQLERDDEVIISDDSSTDSTVAIIKGFRDQRVRIYENNTFFNPIFNFENALKKVTGDIIILSDQDDIWLDNKVPLIRSRLENKLGLIYTVVLDGFYINENGDTIRESIFERYNSGKGLLKNIYDNTYMGCCLAFTMDLLKVALPFPKSIAMHDMWLGLLSELFGEVEFIKEETIKYRRHSSNITVFKRKFDIFTQIKWRYFLVYNLIKRYIAYRNMLYSIGTPL